MRVILWSVTLVRIALIPVFLRLGLAAQEVARNGGDASEIRLAALATLLTMGLTDVADGWIARRFALMSQLGAVADAVADKLVQVALVAFFALSVGPVFTALPFWFLLVIFGRDLVLLVGVSMLRIRYGPIRVLHRLHGRVASIAISAVLIWSAFGLPRAGLVPLSVLAAGIAIVSATLYALDGTGQGRMRASARL